MQATIVTCIWNFQDLCPPNIAPNSHTVYTSLILFRHHHHHHLLRFVYLFVFVYVCEYSLETANLLAMKDMYKYMGVCIVKWYEIKWIHGKNHLIKFDTFIIGDIIYSFVHGSRSISTLQYTVPTGQQTNTIQLM